MIMLLFVFNIKIIFFNIFSNFLYLFIYFNTCTIIILLDISDNRMKMT